ncbi:MAG: TIGR03618 family F420-dependent PPOX class oxidoreductase [Anaerolineae bacterium]
MTTFDPEARSFIEKPWIGRLATVSADGFPHAVPLWYMLDGDDVAITSERKTAKVANLLRDNRAALVVGGEPDQGPAYLIRGRVTITDDPDHVWLSKLTHHYESPEEAAKDLAAWDYMDIVLIRMKVERVNKVY